jgi:hypothetical protein
MFNYVKREEKAPKPAREAPIFPGKRGARA